MGLDYPSKIREELVELLDKTMAEKNLSAGQVAQLIQGSQRSVNNWRSGKCVSIGGIEAALKAMGVHVDINKEEASDG